MVPVKRLFRHKPERGIYGDCGRSSVACILNMRPQDVPHFFDGGIPSVDALEHQKIWLRRRGIVPIECIYPGETDLDEMLSAIAHLNPGLVFILTGTSRTGVGHCVVCCDGKIVCDPSLTDAGIVGPVDGYYWVTFFGAAVAIHTKSAA